MPNLIKTSKHSVELTVHQLLISRKETLSLAESCTGGALAARLTSLSNCSQYFQGSIVAYSNNLKVNLLGIKLDLLEKEGAVSQIIVIQMVKNLLQLTHTDYGIAVSGIAGPGGGSEQKPVGTVWIAVAQKEKRMESQCLHLTGSRGEIIQQSVDSALQLLLELIKSSESNMDK